MKVPTPKPKRYLIEDENDCEEEDTEEEEEADKVDEFDEDDFEAYLMQNSDPASIIVKLQKSESGPNHLKLMKIDKDIELRWLMIRYCEIAGIEYRNTKFMFNGACVRNTDTPLKLSMVDGDTILVDRRGSNQGVDQRSSIWYQTLCIRAHKRRDTFVRVARNEPLLRSIKRNFSDSGNGKPDFTCFFYEGQKLRDLHTANMLRIEDGDVIDAFNFDDNRSSVTFFSGPLILPQPPNLKGNLDINMANKGKDIMVHPKDRTTGRFVMSSTRRTRGGPAQRAGWGKGFVLAPPSPGPSGHDSSVLLGGHVDADDADPESDDHFDADTESEDDTEFVRNQASQPPPRKVERDGRGRYVPVGESSSNSTGRKKAKKNYSWKLTCPVVGGPEVPYLLRSFGGHVAFTSWTEPGKLRPCLKCYERPGWVESMDEIRLSDYVSRKVSESGLADLRYCTTTGIDENLISAFVERWQPDTNTFHMPFGEISILLHDVQLILGIRVDGQRVLSERLLPEDPGLKAKVAVLFGVGIDGAGAPLYKGGGLLTQRLKRLAKSGNPNDSFRAYMMMLVGQTLFMNKSSDRVMARLVPLFADVERVPGYAWGAATLAYLYRQLGVASRTNAQGLSGCLPLLQAWIYEYFPCLRPHSGYRVAGRPHVHSWSRVPRFKGDHQLLEEHRQKLDGLKAEHVRWLPFGYGPQRHCPISLYSGFIRFLSIVEPYQPDRCVRQFGYLQMVPTRMITPAIQYRPAQPKSGYQIVFGPDPDSDWGARTSYIILKDITCRARMSHDCHPRYMSWYSEVSHPYFYPPHRRAQFVRLPLWEEPEICRAVTRKVRTIF